MMTLGGIRFLDLRNLFGKGSILYIYKIEIQML